MILSVSSHANWCKTVFHSFSHILQGGKSNCQVFLGNISMGPVDQFPKAINFGIFSNRKLIQRVYKNKLLTNLHLDKHIAVLTVNMAIRKYTKTVFIFFESIPE